MARTRARISCAAWAGVLLLEKGSTASKIRLSCVVPRTTRKSWMVRDGSTCFTSSATCSRRRAMDASSVSTGSMWMTA